MSTYMIFHMKECQTVIEHFNYDNIKENSGMKEKIYITALHLNHGGVEMAISLLSNALVKRGYEVTILSIYKLGQPAYKLEPSVKIKYLTDVTPNQEAFYKAKNEKSFGKMLKEGLYALKVLYLKKNSMKNAITAVDKGVIISTRNEHSVLLSKFGNKNVLKIAQLHHDHEFMKKYLRDFQNNYSNIDYFVLLTEGLKSEVEEIMQGHNKKTRCIAVPNFLEDVSINVELEQKEKTVVTVGRLHPVKGFERLIELWQMVAKNHEDWKLKIIGGGSIEKKLRKKVNALGLSKQIEIVGAMEHDDVIEEMKKASLYVMTSYSEAFPFVLIEAMSSGLPVVAFDVRVGPRAIIDNNLNGLLITDNELEEFAAGVEMHMDDENKRKNMSVCAMKKAHKFLEEEVMKQWCSILERK